MELVTSWDAIVNAAGAAAMFAFGVWVATLTPRTRASKMLAVFALTAGALYVPFNLIRWVEESTLYFAVATPFAAVVSMAAGLALLGLTRELLSPYGEEAKRAWRVAIIVTVILVVVPIVANAIFTSPGGEAFIETEDFATWWLASLVFGAIGSFTLFGAFIALLLVLAWMFRRPPEGREEATRTQAVLVSGALVLWPAFWVGFYLTQNADPRLAVASTVLDIGLFFAGMVALSILWLVNAWQVPDRSSQARNLALLPLGVVFVGMAYEAFAGRFFGPPAFGPLWGVVRLLTVVGLGYAMLRHEFLGIDAKFRWGLSRTTVAGVFIAVFFVVSEGAQEFFSDQAGLGPWLGILAAGMLVFAFAPIQRIADRFAAKTVPGAAPSGARDEQRRRVYKDAVRLALGDRALSREEEATLARLADELGIGASEAVEVLAEVEDEGVGGSGS